MFKKFCDVRKNMDEFEKLYRKDQYYIGRLKKHYTLEATLLK